MQTNGLSRSKFSILLKNKQTSMNMSYNSLECMLVQSTHNWVYVFVTWWILDRKPKQVFKSSSKRFKNFKTNLDFNNKWSVNSQKLTMTKVKYSKNSLQQLNAKCKNDKMNFNVNNKRKKQFRMSLCVSNRKGSFTSYSHVLINPFRLNKVNLNKCMMQ